MKRNESITPTEERLLVIAPTPRDAQLCCETLAHAGIGCVPCADLQELCTHLEAGAGAALVTEEAFAVDEASLLRRWLQAQPSWSDFPLLFLTHDGTDSAAALRAIDLLGNVILLERPLRRATLISAARAALRERRRQYQTRTHLEMLGSAREAAEGASRAKSEFLANMSHEIRTPMTVIMASLELLQQAASAPERQHFLEMSQNAGERLLHLIDDILDFSRIEAGRLEVRKEPFSLRGCLEKAAGLFRQQAQEKGVRLTVRIDPQVPAIVNGDPVRLDQVLVNLIGNAVKFTEKGEIEVTAEVRRRRLQIRVRDTGIGIPADRMDRLFRSFSQVDSSLTRRHGGTGLGLAICKGLVEMMGGEIRAESREGEGSVFFLTLPLATAVAPAASGTEERIPEAAPLAARILLAEDEPLNQKLITMMLNRRGWKTEVAGTGLEALAKWREGDFDVILMDVQMPDMDGLEATSRIRQLERERGAHTCIIALTAHARPEDREECLAAGMDGFVTKPMRIADLESAIRSCRE
jgi:signal transduction histidine kinase/ActR/RegA family two-component response regulator